MEVLPPEACARLLAAQANAVRELAEACEQLHDEAWHGRAGLPPSLTACALVTEHRRELWQPRLAA